MRRVASFAFVVLSLAAPVSAQSFAPPDPRSRPWSTAQVKLGPLYVAPTFEVRDVGVDRNVFNDEANPKSDLTGKLGLRSLAGIHFGEAFVLQIVQGNDYVYYRRYRSERSVDSALNFTLEFRSAFLRPWIRWDRTKSSERIGVDPALRQ